MDHIFTKGFRGGSVIKNPPANAEAVFDHWVGKIPWRRNGNPLQFSCLGDPVYRGAWWTTVYVVSKESNMA